MEYVKSAEWWAADAGTGDGRIRADLYLWELRDMYGGVDARGWGQRRGVAMAAFGDTVVFAQLAPGMASKIKRTLTAEERLTADPCPVPRDELLKLLKKPQCVMGLANHFDCAPSRIETAVDVLRSEHLLISDTAAGLALATTMEPHRETHRIGTLDFAQEEYCFGVIADMHYGSKYERLDVVDDLADRFAAAGATRVLVPGNWIDGSGRRFNEHDIYVHGVDNQVDNFIAKLPRRDGLEWDILSGDDHEGWYVQDCHVNIGHTLEDAAKRAGRDDIHDIGYMERDIELAQPGGSAKLRVVHMGGGTGYALSYSMQKYAESLQGGEKPKIVIGGHYHKFDYNYAREIHLLQPGCTQDQTPFMRKKKLQAMVGGCLIWITQNELGVVTSFKVEWMPYYDKKFYAYRWKEAAR